MKLWFTGMKAFGLPSKVELRESEDRRTCCSSSAPNPKALFECDDVWAPQASLD